MSCPDTAMFQRLVAGQLAPVLRAQVADHAAGCRSCNQLVEGLVTQVGRSPAPRGGGSWTVGAVIGGRFRIDEILGAGGMGVVVVATHLELGSRVAMKFLRDELLVHRDLVERFIREARAAAGLRTEHICRVLDVDRLESGAPYIVMELLEGVDLARVISRQPVAVALAVDYLLQACVALAEAHAAGIVHRDLKPANLFLTRRPDGTELVKVLDFGIAKAFSDDASLTQARVAMGSPGFMSPEQLESARDVDARADIWALGVTLYQLVSGRLPFWAPNATEIAIKVTSEPPAPIALDAGLHRVVLRCLEKAPARRYPDVAALAQELAPYGTARAGNLATTIGRLAVAGAHAVRPAARLANPQGVAAPVAVRAAEPGRDAVVARPGRRTRPALLAVVAGLGVLGAGLVVALLRKDADAGHGGGGSGQLAVPLATAPEAAPRTSAASAPDAPAPSPDGPGSSSVATAAGVDAAPNQAAVAAAAAAEAEAAAARAENERKQALLDYSMMEDRYLNDAQGQWASTAKASSMWGTTDPTTKTGYAPLQATGVPDEATWCNSNRDMGVDWIELGFARPVVATEVRLVLHGTMGALNKIEAIDEAGAAHLVWSGLDETKRDDRGPRTWVVKPVSRSSRKTAKVKLTFANAVAPGYKEVDAVQLVGE